MEKNQVTKILEELAHQNLVSIHEFFKTIKQHRELLISPLLSALSSKDRHLRENAIWALRKFEVKEAFPLFFEIALRKDEDPAVRISALGAFRSLDDQEFICFVSRFVEKLKDEKLDVRVCAATALGHLGPRAASVVPDLISIAQNSTEDSHLRLMTLWALGKMGEKKAVAPLRKILGEVQKNEYLCSMALSSLGGLGASEAIPDFIQKLDSPLSQVRAEAAEALGRLKVQEAVSLLIEILAVEEDLLVKLKAISALGRIGLHSPMIEHLLREFLKDKNNFIRAQAAYALGQLEGDFNRETIVAELCQALEDEESSVRMNAARGLALLAPHAKKALPQLSQNMKNKNSLVRMAARLAIDKIDPTFIKYASA